MATQRSVQRRFPGGVHLITIGRDVRGRAAIAAKVAEETHLLTGDTGGTSSDPERAGSYLGALLAQRPRTLLIIDDVWESEQLTPFLRGAERSCVRLVTTRRPSVLPDTAVRIEVDRMTVEQARQLLTHRLPTLPEPKVVEQLVKATGRWALLLSIANKLLFDQTGTGADATVAARDLLQRLSTAGPAFQDTDDDTLDLSDPAQRNTAIRASIRAATTLLQREHAERRFSELGIFAEDESIPMGLVATLWEATGGLDETAVRSLCKQMADLSLIGIDTAVPGGAVALHDVVRDYLRTELGEEGCQTVNRELLNAVAASLPRLRTVRCPGGRSSTATCWIISSSIFWTPDARSRRTASRKTLVGTGPTAPTRAHRALARPRPHRSFRPRPGPPARPGCPPIDPHRTRPRPGCDSA